MEENKDTNVTTEQIAEVPAEGKEKRNLFERLDKAKKSEQTFGNKLGEKMENFFAKFGRGFYTVRCVCCFTALFSTPGWIMIYGTDPTLQAVAAIFVLIGFLSTLLACPGRIIVIWLGLIVNGFSIGLCFIGVGCIVGLCIGILLGGALAFAFPAAITIPYFFKELRYK